MPMPNLEDDKEWEIEEVKDRATIKGTTHYLVKWEGWPTGYNQWIPEEDMGNAQEAIRWYERNKRKKVQEEGLELVLLLFLPLGYNEDRKASCYSWMSNPRRGIVVIGARFGSYTR